VDGVIVREPLTPSDPLQLPDAVQADAYGDDQLIVVDESAGIVVWPKVKVGAGGTMPLLKLTELLGDTTFELEFVQASEYVRIPVTVGVNT
jgi:hypothetical protein